MNQYIALQYIKAEMEQANDTVGEVWASRRFPTVSVSEDKPTLVYIIVFDTLNHGYGYSEIYNHGTRFKVSIVTDRTRIQALDMFDRKVAIH